jgi:DNA-binding beta-propeller fold protein YncE
MLVAMSVGAAMLGGNGCGRGIFPFATTTATTSATASPGLGSFVYASNFNDGKISAFSRNVITGALTLIGTLKAGSGGLTGLAVTPNDGFLYALDSNANRVREYTINSNGTLGLIGTDVTGVSPQQVAIDATGSFVYTTNAGGTVSQFTIGSGGGLATNGAVPGFSSPYGIVAHPLGGFIYVSDNASGLVFAFSIGADGKLTQVGNASPSMGTSLGRPGLMTIAMDASNAVFLFVPDTVLATISEFTIQSDGSLVFGGTFGSAGNTKPVGIALANNGGGSGTNFLYTANQMGNFVQFFTRSGAFLTPSSAASGLNAPTGLVSDPQGNFLYTGELGGGTVAELQINGGSTCGLLCVVAHFPTENPPNPGAGTQFVAITH